MSIEKNKIEKIANDVILNNLLLGYVPTSDEVILQISDVISKQNIEDPFYQFEVKKSVKANDINQAKNTIREDIDLLLGSIFEVYDLTQLQGQKIKIEKERQEKRLQELETTLEQLSLKYSVAGYISGYINAISAVGNFDMDSTTAFIDTLSREMTLAKNEDIVVNNYDVRILSGDPIQSNGNINTFSRSEGLLWNGVYATKNKNQYSSIVLAITLKESANLLKLNMPMLKPCHIEVLQAEVAGAYSHVHTGKIDGYASLAVNKKSKYIQITLWKEEADKYDAASGYFYYYYLIDTIQLFSSQYLLSSYFKTKEIEIPEDANSIYLLAEEDIPSSCKVEYYISSNDEEWFPINNKSVLNRNIIDYNIYQNINNDASRSINSFYSPEYSSSRIDLYSLAHVHNNSIINPRLYKGIDSWKESTYLLTAPITGLVSKKYFLDQAKTGREPIVSYIPISPAQPGYVYNTQSVQAISAIETRITLEKNASSIEKTSVIHSYPITIYLNGKIIYESLIAPSPVKLTWQFKKGQNTIEIYTNISEPNVFVPTTQNIMTTYIGMDLLKNNQNRYGEESVAKELSLSNLQYNSFGMNNVYSLVKEGEESHILINNQDIFLPYKFVYNSLNRGSNKLYIAGTLSSPDPKITPKIKLIETRYSKL